MKKQPSRLVFNNTSMLDVIFIILIFFISVSRLQEGWLNIKLPEARASETPEQRAAKEALVVSIDADNRVLANERPLAGDAELAALARRYAGEAGADAPVVFVADRASRSGTLVSSLKTVSDAGLRNITFNYQPRKEKR